MNRTTNYKLCQWEAEDKVQRTDFNEDNAKLDGALAAVEEHVRQVQATVPKIEVGTYMGDSKAERFIKLGFTPRVVLLSTRKGRMHDRQSLSHCYLYGGMALAGHELGNGYGQDALIIQENGFKVFYNTDSASDNAFTNAHNTTYYYLAIG